MRIIVIGASMGGLKALTQLVENLPANLDASVFIVMHTSSESPDYLATLLNRNPAFPTVYPRDGETIKPRVIYVAPANKHLVVSKDKVRAVYGPRENGHRPAIDALFRTASIAYGPRVVGVILTGQLDDGAEGLWLVKHNGGVAIVQDPKDAEYAGMPLSALKYTHADYCIPLKQIPARLASIAQKPVEEAFLI